MIDTVYRWSPEPPPGSELKLLPDASLLSGLSTDMWNLIWISIPFENGSPISVRQVIDAAAETLPYILSYQGKEFSVRYLAGRPAVEFAAIAVASPDTPKLPLVKLLGSEIMSTWKRRKDIARIDHPAALQRMADYKAEDIRAAEIILRRFK